MTEEIYEKRRAAFEAASAAYEARKQELQAFAPTLDAAVKEDRRLRVEKKLAEKDMLERKAALKWGVEPGDAVWAVFYAYDGERRTPAFYMGYKTDYSRSCDLRPVKKNGTMSGAKKYINYTWIEPRDPKDF